MNHAASHCRRLGAAWRAWLPKAALLLAALAPAAQAQETTCARVKIEIKQELTLERQAFDAEMKIHNTTDTSVIQNVSVVVKVMEENGTPVTVTEDPNNVGARFFVRVSNRENIVAVDGTGQVAPRSTAVINWLLIPAPGAAGTSPLGKKYLVGATLRYRYAGEDTTLEVSPDVITVKPMPLLTLDYFLPETVQGDDPVTPAVEPTVPFTLGVRIKNNGVGTAKTLKIDSAQPKIIDNAQGLLINFKLTGSYVDDAPVNNTLLIDFGDIASQRSKTGRWIMESSLEGRFTEFTASFSHADELGGSVTSLLQATNAHLMLRDVRVDLPGRDLVRDFLARDGDVLRVYESEGLDTQVTDRSAVAVLTATTSTNGNAAYTLTMPATAGFVYARLPDPFGGTKALGTLLRSDAKAILPENLWLSRTRNAQTQAWEYWVHVFDVNTTGEYRAEFQAPAVAPRPPVIQAIANKVTQETKQVSFIVEASSPDGRPVQLSAAPLPVGATFSMQAPDPQQPGLARAVFDWTPPLGSVGNYLVVYTAQDGLLSATRSASIRVDAKAPELPGVPTVQSPAAGASVTVLRPALAVLPSDVPLDPTTKLQFELYADEAMSQLVATALVDKAPPTTVNGQVVPQPTIWLPPADLNDNQRYWWRARAFDGTQYYSPWVAAWFFVNQANDAPEPFNATSPAPDSEVATLQPTLAWTNSSDRDGDAITYTVAVYRNAGLTDLVVASPTLPPGAAGSTSWTVGVALVNHARYWWRATATDALGASTVSVARSFVVNTGNAAPTAPSIASPAAGAVVSSTTVALTVNNATDTDNDLLTYVFELDTVPTFDSALKRTSGQVVQGAGSTTAWTVNALVENQRYHWRGKAQDGRAESAWVVGSFLMSAVNEAPPAPTVANPGNASWVATVQPVLEANPVQDPEGDAVRYEFEVFSNATLTQRVATGISATTAWVVSPSLADKTTHWWRVRALDVQGLASAWSATTVLYVSTGTYQNPSIQVTAPSTIVTPDTVGTSKQTTLSWTGTAPNLEANVSLYYGPDNTSFAGTLIAEGLRQSAGTASGSRVWDVTALPPGAYYVYGLIADPKGSGRAYAPGTLVVPNPTQTGTFVRSKSSVSTSETGTSANFTVRLGNAPTQPVTIGVTVSNPREGSVAPASLTFTPANWSTAQTVTVTGRDDCVVDGSKTHQVVFGKASTLDLNYAGLVAAPVTVTNADAGDTAGTTDSPELHICGYVLVAENILSSTSYEYVFRASLTNTGPAKASVQATMSLPTGNQILDGVLAFGALGSGDTVSSAPDTVTFRRTRRLTNPVSYIRTNARWTVVAVPAQ